MSDPIQSAGVKITEQAVSKQENNPAEAMPEEKDINDFQKAMTEPEQIEPSSSPDDSAVPSVDTSEGAASGLGEQILKGMEQLGERREEQVENINKMLSEGGDEPMSVQDTLRMQFELMRMTQEQEVTTKVADKSGQGVQTLLKNQ